MTTAARRAQAPRRLGPRRPVPDPRQAIIYLRVSTGLQERDGYGLDTQFKECQALAAREQMPVVRVIQDVDSGTEWDLPGVHETLDLVEQAPCGTLFIYDPDRLSRSLGKYVWLDRQLAQLGVRPYYVTVGVASTEEERLFHDINAVFAEWDHRRIVRRMASGMRRKVEAGYRVGLSEAPHDYQYVRNERGKQVQLAIDETRAPIVRRIFTGITRVSIRATREQLNAEAVPTARPRRAATGWYPATIMGILTNPTYVGRLAYGRRAGKAKVPGWDSWLWLYTAVPALITMAEWDAAHVALGRPRSCNSAPRARPRRPTAS